MESPDDLVVHFVHAAACRDWCVGRSRYLLLRGDTFADGFVGSLDPRGETFRHFDPDFRCRAAFTGTGDSKKRTRERARRTCHIAAGSLLNFHGDGA